MNNKQILNERVLGLAGIKPMTSIGLSRNGPITENGMSIDDFYRKVADSKDPEELLIMATGGEFGPEIESEVQKDYSKTALEINAHEDDDFEDIYGAMIHKIDSSHEPSTNKNVDGRYGSLDEDKPFEECDTLSPEEYETVQNFQNFNEEDWEWDSSEGGVFRRIRPHSPLNEQTIKETIGATRNSTQYTPHSKSLLNERMMGFAGITPLKPIGFVSTNAPSVDTSEFMNYLNEDTNTLSKSDLYMKLPMLHSNVLMELAEQYTTSPAGQSWGAIVESLADVYYTNNDVKDSIHEAIKNAGIL